MFEISPNYIWNPDHNVLGEMFSALQWCGSFPALPLLTVHLSQSAFLNAFSSGKWGGLGKVGLLTGDWERCRAMLWWRTRTLLFYCSKKSLLNGVRGGFVHFSIYSLAGWLNNSVHKAGCSMWSICSLIKRRVVQVLTRISRSWRIPWLGEDEMGEITSLICIAVPAFAVPHKSAGYIPDTK